MADNFRFRGIVSADPLASASLKSFCVVVVCDSALTVSRKRNRRNFSVEQRPRGHRIVRHEMRLNFRALCGHARRLFFRRTKFLRRFRQGSDFFRRIPFHKLQRAFRFFPGGERAVLQIQRRLSAHIMRIPRHPAILVADVHVVHRMMVRSSRHKSIAPAKRNPSAGIAQAPHPGLAHDRVVQNSSVSRDGIGQHFLAVHFIGTFVEPHAIESYVRFLRAARRNRSRRWLLNGSLLRRLRLLGRLLGLQRRETIRRKYRRA